MLTLYDAARCPYCARVRIVLAEKAVRHEIVEIDLGDRPGWLFEKNPPDARVPVLEEDDWVLPESQVINEYLEERYPDPRLLPSDLAERAAARLVVLRFDDFGRPYYALRRGEPGAEEMFSAKLVWLDAVLGRGPYLTGREFGLADVAYVPWVIRARETLGVSLDGYEALSAWLDRLAERPSVAAELATVAALAR